MLQVGALRSTPAKPVLLRHAAARAESQTANITPGGATGAPQRLRQTSSNPGASGPLSGWYSEQQSQLGGGATSQQFQQMGQGVSRDPLQQAYQAADTQHENFEVRDYDARYKNSIVLVGTLASEPQMRYFDGGGGVLKMNLAFKNSRNRDGWCVPRHFCMHRSSHFEVSLQPMHVVLEISAPYACDQLAV